MADDAIQSFLTTYEHGDGAHSIPERHIVTCCCGDESCAYLKHNQDALESLERDVLTAGQLGKALLLRHETYIADSERERKTMTAHIEHLEGAKVELERQNALAIEENRALLDQLEGLNNNLVDSNAQVTTLQDTLQSTHHELHRLSQLAARTARLEQELADFEREQAFWQTTLDAKEQSEKSAVRRWHEAQRTLTNLQDQIEHIENEAKAERERHDEVVCRMERRHTVEKELNSAAGRLKGAAAWKTAGNNTEGTTVVSHFVKDILQDNANLQMGIVELRDMLHNSNEEVETLRKRLSIHQPAETEDETALLHQASHRPHLNEEMRRATAQELHVHHHYHAPAPAPAPAAVSKSNNLRRPKKKRYGSLTSNYLAPSSGTSTPRSSFSHGVPSSSAAILSQTAASLPEHIPINNRWSTLSAATCRTISSGPSSPRSTHHGSSVFDRVFSDAGHDSSRPSTPDTEDLGSPLMLPVRSKRAQNPSHSFAMPIAHRAARPSLDSIIDMNIEDLRQFDPSPNTEHAIPEEDEEIHWDDSTSPAFEDSDILEESSTGGSQALDFDHRSIRRAASHESLISISGMDIHTLKSRPSQLLTLAGSRSLTPQAVISDTTAHAAMSSRNFSGHSILSDMAAEAIRPHATFRPSLSSNSSGASSSGGGGGKQGLSQRMGGWMFGRWGATPIPTANTASAGTSSNTNHVMVTATTTTTTSSSSSTSTPTRNHTRAPSIASGSDGKSLDDPQATPKKFIFRTPGINQAGPIPGFGPEIKILHPPILGSLDRDALKSLLGEGGNGGS